MTIRFFFLALFLYSCGIEIRPSTRVPLSQRRTRRSGAESSTLPKTSQSPIQLSEVIPTKPSTLSKLSRSFTKPTGVTPPPSRKWKYLEWLICEHKYPHSLKLSKRNKKLNILIRNLNIRIEGQPQRSSLWHKNSILRRHENLDNFITMRGYHLIHEAIAHRLIEFLDLLLKYVSDPFPLTKTADERYFDSEAGMSPLFIALIHAPGAYDFVQKVAACYKKHGYDLWKIVGKLTSKGHSAIQQAQELGDKELIALIEEKLAEPTCSASSCPADSCSEKSTIKFVLN